MCVTESKVYTFAFLTVFYLHVRHETLLDPPAVFVDFIQILKLIVISATHFKNQIINALLTAKYLHTLLRLFLFFSWSLYGLSRGCSGRSAPPAARKQTSMNNISTLAIFIEAILLTFIAILKALNSTQFRNLCN